jgi:YVTN family beta-propeller protein
MPRTHRRRQRGIHPRRRTRLSTGAALGLIVATATMLAHWAPSDHRAQASAPTTQEASTTTAATSGAATTPSQGLLPGMPAPLNPQDLYAADGPGMLAPILANVTPRVWVPNSDGHTLTEIDPNTYQVLHTYDVGRNPQHVVPSWDLKTLWVNNDKGNSLTPIDALTGQVGQSVDVHDPYNLYFTPDGKSAVVMASADKQIVFRDPHTMAVQDVVPVPCDGVNHADFSPDGRYMIVSCEFTPMMLKIDVAKRQLLGTLALPGGMPQDVKIAPDGKTWYVADMDRNGLFVLDGDNFKVTGFIDTGKGAHGLYVSRDSKTMYVTNRGEGTISLFDFATGKVTGKWVLPGGGSPDMGGLNVDGTQLWLTGRYNKVVYVIDTATGKLLHKIPVGPGPHGLCFWPQPGRYSLGHTGILR